MSVTTTNNIMDVFVAGDVASATYSTSNTDVLASINAGEIGVVGFHAASNKEELLGATSTGANVTMANYPYIRFVKKTQSGELLYGSRIYGKDLVFAKSTKAVLAAEQVYFIGYNGTSGSIDVSQANEFMVTIAYDHDDMMWSEQKLRNTYDYYSTAPTQQGVALSMVSQINYKENLGKINGTGPMVRAEMLTNGTFTASSAGAFTVAQDSNTITVVESAASAADAGKYNADASTFAVGDMIRIGGTGNTSPVYTITAISGAGTALCTITLNTPYQGTSGSVLAANVGYIATTANLYGVKITGQALTWKKDFFKYNKVKFHFDLKGFGSTYYDKPGSITSSSSESTKGKGFWQEVSELESFSAGFQGALNRTVVPLPTGLNEVPANTPSFGGASTGYGAYYNMWYLESRDTNNSSAIVANAPMRIQTYCFFPDGTNGDAMQNNLVSTSAFNVDAWVASTGASGSIASVSAP